MSWKSLTDPNLEILETQKIPEIRTIPKNLKTPKTMIIHSVEFQNVPRLSSFNNLLWCNQGRTHLTPKTAKTTRWSITNSNILICSICLIWMASREATQIRPVTHSRTVSSNHFPCKGSFLCSPKIKTRTSHLRMRISSKGSTTVQKLSRSQVHFLNIEETWTAPPMILRKEIATKASLKDLRTKL